MSLIRWEPFSGMDEAFSRLMGPALRWNLPDSRGGSRFEWAPSVDISETGKEYLIRAELPAVKKEDLQVTFEDGLLTVSGERKQRQEDKGEKFHRVESFYGKFSRCFTLPESVDAASINAESKDGIVTIHVPKLRTEARKPIEIKVQ
jgi:HSP20 family protein